jgi:Cys-tRNA(Pro)/Cys-tRNA(Cys) deacylase
VSTPALAAVEATGLPHRVIRHGPVRSLAEAAQARGVSPADVVKTLVVRRGDDDFLFVLVPGDRTISWPKLRKLLGVSRLSMPDASVARQATGYERGTITPFGSARPWPVIADERVRGHEITLGAGEHGVAVAADADDILQALGASIADISGPSPRPNRPEPGTLIQPPGPPGPRRAAVSGQWLSQLVNGDGDRIVPAAAVAQTWGRLNVPDPVPVADGPMAATAQVHDWTPVTRNIGDVASTGVRYLDPYARTS